VKQEYITIRPTAGCLIRLERSVAPAPVFVVEWNPRSSPRSVFIDLAPDPGAFLTRSCEHFEIKPPDGGAHTFEWKVPAPVWERLADYPRVYYRATARFGIRRIVFSVDSDLPGELPFLHGLQSNGFYERTVSPVDLPRLRVEGSALLRDDTSSQCVLRGVNVSGLNYARYFHAPTGRWSDAACITPELLDRLKAMHVNVIRLPLNQDWLLMGYHEPELPEYHQTQSNESLSYLEDVDRIVTWAADRGMYVLLSLHTLRLSTPRTGRRRNESREDRDSLHHRMSVESWKQPYNAHLPDHRSWLFWSVLAQRYCGCSAVLFDLCNEPHEVRKWYDDSHEYRGKRPPTSRWKYMENGAESLAWWADEWMRWAAELEELVHTMNPEALVFISGFGGPSWSSSLERMEFRSPIGNPNVILAVHWYWSTALGPEVWRRHMGLERPLNYPVFVTEWGVETHGAIGCEPGDLVPGQTYATHWGNRPVPAHDTLTGWGESLADFFVNLVTQDARGHDQRFAGFTAWSTGDRPRIFKREGMDSGSYEPGFPLTDYGKIVENLLARIEDPGKRKIG
jgi:hypothetical protein